MVEKAEIIFIILAILNSFLKIYFAINSLYVVFIEFGIGPTIGMSKLEIWRRDLKSGFINPNFP